MDEQIDYARLEDRGNMSTKSLIKSAHKRQRQTEVSNITPSGSRLSPLDNSSPIVCLFPLFFPKFPPDPLFIARKMAPGQAPDHVSISTEQEV